MALVVVFMVSVEEPKLVIEAGLKPLLVMPAGKPPSLPTLRVTVPLNPVRGVTVTVKVADCPGTTETDVGLTAIEKSGVDGSTAIVRVDGLGSELPLPSITVNDVTYVPGVMKVTFPGFCAVEVAGDQPGKTHE